MRYPHILFCLIILIARTGYSKSFNDLSSVSPVSINYVATEEGYKNVQLLAVNKNKEFDSIPLKLQYEIGNDTLIDYIMLGDAFNAVVKTLYLYENESLNVHLFILSNDSIVVEKIKGNLKLSDPMVLSTNTSPNRKEFIGNYWDVKQSSMFKINKFDSVPQITRFNVVFNENYVFDKFYYQINVLSPDSSFYSVEGEVNINKESYLNFSELSVDLIQEVGASKTGKYILEIVPLMNMQRVNGIKSIGYQLINIQD